jgi:signal transduction histidine kinase
MLIALFIHAVADTLYTFELLGHSFSAFNYLNVYWLVAFALQYWSAWEQDNKNSIRQHADKIDNSAPRLMAAYEALMPALCIVVIVVTGIGYHDRVTSTLVLIAGPPLVAFACFLGLREWYTHKVESSLHQAVYEANKTLEQRVHERTHALKTSNMELESFCYSVSHDLRTPLRAINGYASALREDYQHTFDKDGRNYLARIREASIRMGELIDSMLQLSRLSRQQLCREQIDLTQLSNKTVQQLQQQNPDHKMDVSIQDNLQTHGDPALVAILFDNLFGNAWKYTGKIPNPKVEFGCHHNGTGAVYYVRDNGVGFDMRYVDKLFKPFQRLHRDTEFPGYGIGLATVSRIIRLHGGEVWAESSAGEGTTISFTLEPSPSRSEQQFVQMSE